MGKQLAPLYSWHTAIAESDLPPTAKHVALTLALYMTPMHPTCFPSIPTLMRDTSRGRNTVIEALNVLEAEGFITRERGGGRGRSTVYTAGIPAINSPMTGLYKSGKQSGLRQETVRSQVPEVTNEVTKLEGSKEPSRKKATKEERDGLWDAVVKVCNISSVTTPSSRSFIGKTVNELIEAEASPEEVGRRATRWAEMYPDAELTPGALTKHWDRLNGHESDGYENDDLHTWEEMQEAGLVR